MKYSMVKRILMVSLAGAICLGAALVTYAAPSGQGRRGQMGQETEADGSDNAADGMRGERPEPPEGMEEGERPEPPEGLEEGERPELPEGLEEGERPELPDGAENGERPELPENADKSGCGRGEKGGRKELPEGAVNIMAYKDALKEAEDEETKASLQGYIDTLENALKAEREARDSENGLTDEESSSYSKAVTEASEALKKAFEEAGIEVNEEMRGRESRSRDELPEGVSANRPAADERMDTSDDTGDESREHGTGTKIKERTDNRSASDEAETEVSSDNTVKRSAGKNASGNDNFWNRIKGWFNDLF